MDEVQRIWVLIVRQVENFTVEMTRRMSRIFFLFSTNDRSKAINAANWRKRRKEKIIFFSLVVVVVVVGFVGSTSRNEPPSVRWEGWNWWYQWHHRTHPLCDGRIQIDALLTHHRLDIPRPTLSYTWLTIIMPLLLLLLYTHTVYLLVRFSHFIPSFSSFVLIFVSPLQFLRWAPVTLTTREIFFFFFKASPIYFEYIMLISLLFCLQDMSM
jgi:hypothetical protein